MRYASATLSVLAPEGEDGAAAAIAVTQTDLVGRRVHGAEQPAVCECEQVISGHHQLHWGIVNRHFSPSFKVTARARQALLNSIALVRVVLNARSHWKVHEMPPRTIFPYVHAASPIIFVVG
ncbi:hypothetical protein [Paraburkholderia strydomiana]|uniref:hypothetical protein n=1 Tax=Paraburkholderia strydomiana TaxID=1245417 RepID=UPI001BE87832|nr:hypothetical protein [Paraburkholderia strydomiana]MBT2792757.1 hypothetical protein [Paraburkholderia strydomiana]